MSCVHLTCLASHEPQRPFLHALVDWPITWHGACSAAHRPSHGSSAPPTRPCMATVPHEVAVALCMSAPAGPTKAAPHLLQLLRSALLPLFCFVCWSSCVATAATRFRDSQVMLYKHVTWLCCAGTAGASSSNAGAGGGAGESGCLCVLAGGGLWKAHRLFCVLKSLCIGRGSRAMVMLCVDTLLA